MLNELIVKKIAKHKVDIFLDPVADSSHLLWIKWKFKSWLQKLGSNHQLTLAKTIFNLRERRLNSYWEVLTVLMLFF